MRRIAVSISMLIVATLAPTAAAKVLRVGS